MTEPHPQQNLLALAKEAEHHEPLTYEKLKTILDHTTAHPSMGVQLAIELKRIAVAIGALAGRALGVNDFCYRLTNGEVRTKRLRMWVNTKPLGQFPDAELRLSLTNEGFIFLMGELVIRHVVRTVQSPSSGPH